MVSINFTGLNDTFIWLGMSGIDPNILFVGYEHYVTQYAWWFLAIVGVCMGFFIYTRSLMVAIMTIIGLSTSIIWFQQTDLTPTIIYTVEAVLSLLIVFVVVFLLYSRGGKSATI